MRRDLVLWTLAALAACGGGGGGSGGRGGPDGGTGGDGGGSPHDGALPPIDAPTPPPPAQTCPLPEKAVDVTHPTTVVGSGTAASCTEKALDAAVAKGGVVTFDCGKAPATITVTSEVEVTKGTTLDGAGLVTLSGGSKSRILHIKSAWNVTTPLLTVQNLTFVDGFTSDVVDTSSTSEGGAAIFEDGGALVVIHCTFKNNQCASTGQDVSGGAINGQGSSTLVVEDSVFVGNGGSNGGAIGTQDEAVTIVDSTFSHNRATGNMGNPGNGGDGGAMSYDGAHIPWTMCGDVFEDNFANAQGGAIFRVGYNDEPANIDRCTFDGNGVDMTMGIAGGLYLENLTITMSATTISNNSANYGAGLWAGQSAIANLTNVTIADNHANMGGGVWFANDVTGKFWNVTIADNPGNGLFGGDTGVVLENCLVAGNTAGPDEGDTQCDHTHGEAGANMQTSGAGAQCTSSVITADPKLGPLQDNGGPTFTLAPATGSPAIGKGTSCPAEDQRGQPRKSACTLGAYEVQ